MIQVEEPKLIFVHNQKAAGMSVEDYLTRELGGSMLLERHAYAEDGIKKLGRVAWEGYFTFGFVRNPWDRLVSWYVMIQETPPNKPNQLWEYVHEHASSFEDFIRNCTDTITEQRGGFAYRKSFIRPQYDYFTDDQGNIAVKFIGRFESLQTDFNYALVQVGLPPHQLPHLNTTRQKNYREFYTDETREIVAERFKKDIENFGYSF